VIEKYINIQDYFCTFVLDFKPKAKFFFRQISPNFFSLFLPASFLYQMKSNNQNFIAKTIIHRNKSNKIIKKNIEKTKRYKRKNL